MHSAMTPSIGHNRVFYPIFDHHIYTGQIQYILGQKFWLQHRINSLSLIKMQNGEYFSLYFAMMLYNNALNMHAGIGVCFISYN